MRLIAMGMLLALMSGPLTAEAATGRIVKVLPFYLDQKGRDSLSPSLFDRDAYQAQLRLHPEKVTGRRFAVEWRTKGSAWEPLRLKLELRGVAVGNLPKSLSVDKTVKRQGWFRTWTNFLLSGGEYRDLGEITAWRVTLWEGTRLLSEEKSFLW